VSSLSTTTHAVGTVRSKRSCACSIYSGCFSTTTHAVGTVRSEPQLRAWLETKEGSAPGAALVIASCEEHNSTPLVRAVRERDIALVEYLCDVTHGNLEQLENEVGDGHTALTAACAIGCIPAAHCLVARGCSINRETSRGRTALIEASKDGQARRELFCCCLPFFFFHAPVQRGAASESQRVGR
jgi:hypothetical protein